MQRRGNLTRGLRTTVALVRRVPKAQSDATASPGEYDRTCRQADQPPAGRSFVREGTSSPPRRDPRDECRETGWRTPAVARSNGGDEHHTRAAGRAGAGGGPVSNGRRTGPVDGPDCCDRPDPAGRVPPHLARRVRRDGHRPDQVGLRHRDRHQRLRRPRPVRHVRQRVGQRRAGVLHRPPTPTPTWPAGRCTSRPSRRTNRGGHYTSARLKTGGRGEVPLFAQRYGRVEFRAKLPTGQGLWPAPVAAAPGRGVRRGWAASGEIDVMENRGSQPDVVQGTIHYGGDEPEERVGRAAVPACPTAAPVADWHVYGLDWQPGRLAWVGRRGRLVHPRRVVQPRPAAASTGRGRPRSTGRSSS